MSWKQKIKSVSGNQIIDNSITFDNLSSVKDEDDMASNSSTHLSTQQSIKSYVDNKVIESHAANNFVAQALTTSTTTVWTDFNIPAYSEKRLHTAKFEFMLTSGSSTYRNDVYFYPTVVKPSTSTAYSLGTATYHSVPTQYVNIVTLAGDITEKLTVGGSIGLNLDSSGYFADRSVTAYYYNHSDNKTYLTYNGYPSGIVASGSPVEIFFDPFHWLGSGSSVFLELYHLELPYSQQNGLFTLETRLGYFDQALTYRLQAREDSGGDVITVNSLRHSLKTRKV